MEVIDPTVPKQPGSSHPFMCAVCSKSYARIDHLARHSRQHTQERPFRCSECGKCFGRADLLKRHARLHTPEADAKRRQRQALQPRTRVSQACANCAAAKIKCTQDKPCKRCETQGLVCETASKVYANRNVSPTTATTSTPSSPLCPGPVSPHSPSTSVRETAPQGESNPSVNETARDLQEEQAAGGPCGPLQQRFSDQLPLNLPFADGHDPMLTDFLADLPQTDETHEADRTFAEPHSNDNEFFSGRLSAVLGSFGGIDPISFHAAPPKAGTYELFETEGQRTESFWGYHTALATTSHKPPPAQHELTQPQTVLSNTSGPSWQGEYPRQEAEVPVTFDNNENSHTTPSTSPHNIRNDAVEEDHSEANRNPKLLHRFLPASRDQIISLLANVCSQERFQKIARSLYSSEFLNDLLENCVASAERSIDSWVHLASLDVDTIRPELLTMLVANGAIMSSKRDVQNLGYVMEEACRLAILNKVIHGCLHPEHARKHPLSNQSAFERLPTAAHHSDWDKLAGENLQLLQAYALQLNAGMWSGYHDKVKNGEADMLPLITTLRRWGLLRFRKMPAHCRPTYQDSPDVLHSKWLSWIEHESLKRLVYHMHIHSCQVSMSLQTPPLMSYAELSLELPVPAAIWRAPTAEAWRDLFTVYSRELNDGGPKFGNCIFDMREIASHSTHVDIELVLHLILYSYWVLIWDYRQFITMTEPSSSTPLSSFKAQLDFGPKSQSPISRQGIETLLERFQTILAQKHIPLRMETQMLYQLVSASLHAPFEYLHLLAGMHGEDEARCAYPHVKRWFGSRPSRQSVWHAGQLLRVTATVPSTNITVLSMIESSSRSSNSPSNFESRDSDVQEYEKCDARSGKLRGFEVIAIYNAWLVLWAYGLMARTKQQECRQIDRVLSHISFGSSMIPSPVTVAQDSSRGSDDNERLGISADDQWIYLDGDCMLSTHRRDEFIIKNKGVPILHCQQPSWLQNGRKCASEMEPSRSAEGAEDYADVRSSNTPTDALRGDQPNHEQAGNDYGSFRRPEDLTGIPLHEASQVAQFVIKLIKTLTTVPGSDDERVQCEEESEIPFLAESLTRLMIHLGRAADEIG